MDEFEDIGPCVVMASPGMMQSGLSRELFEAWCTDKKSGVIIAGYCVEGTLAKHLLNESPSEIASMAGQKLKVNCSVEYISFSAHTDFKQTSQFIRSLKPAHIILVHGEQSEMQKLKDALIRQYEDTEYNIQVYNPRNTQPVELYFRGEKSAKVIGKLASNTMPKTDTEISGILVKRNFKYHLMSPEDLHSYTDLAISTIIQRQSIPYKTDSDLILYSLERVFGSMKKYPDSNRFRLFDAIDIIVEKNFLILEWSSSPINDFYADSLLSEILKLELEESKTEQKPKIFKDIDGPSFKENLLSALDDMFDTNSIKDNSEGEDEILVEVDNKTIKINLKQMSILCEEDKQLEQIVTNVVNQIRTLS